MTNHSGVAPTLRRLRSEATGMEDRVPKHPVLYSEFHEAA
jgi:hypothetical protein